MNYTTSAPKRRLFRFQFGLRTLTLVMLIAGCSLGWIASQRKQSLHRRQWLQSLPHGSYGLDVPKSPPPATWTETILGEDPFAYISSCSLREATTAELANLNQMPRLSGLILESFNATESNWLQVAELTNLRSFELRDSYETSDSMLVHLRRMKRLERLDLSNTPVTDAGLRQISDLPNLQYLSLDFAQITGEGLAHLQELNGLKGISLVQTNISDEGLEHLAALPNLWDLKLNLTDVTDIGVKSLARSQSLKQMDLSYTSVSDVGLSTLQTIISLRNVWVTGTKVTGSGVERFKKARRDCNLKCDVWKNYSNKNQATDDDLAELKQKPDLREVFLYRGKVTDAGLVHLRELRDLFLIDLQGTQVTDMGLAQLADLHKLDYLNLSETRITDAGLQHLAGLNQLIHLDLTHTQVTESGAAELKKLLPRCRIWTGDHDPFRAVGMSKYANAQLLVWPSSLNCQPNEASTAAPTEPAVFAPPKPATTVPLDPAVCEAAIGDLRALPEPIRYLFKPGSDFEALAAPGPYDWLTKHEERGQTFDDYRKSDHHQRTSGRDTIYLLPLGEFGAQAPSVERVRRFTETYFQTKTRLLPTIPIDPHRFGVRTNRHTEKPQVLAPLLLERVAQRLPRDACCVMGITMHDLYPDADWNYVFGQASLTNRVGVFSFARFDPEFLDEPRGENFELDILRRSCRVLAHETCHMFGMHHCIYYQCVVNGANHRQEMDSKPLQLCPVCLRKLHSALRFEPRKRYEQLAKLYREFAFVAEAEWLERRVRGTNADDP